MYELHDYINKHVLIHTVDSRIFMAELLGYDHNFNLVLNNVIERCVDLNGVEEIPLGLYFIRGDVIALIAASDKVKEDTIDWTKIKAAPLKEIVIRRV